MNQAAHDRISLLHPSQVRFSETEIEVKNEGKLLAYAAQLVDAYCEPWLYLNGSRRLQSKCANAEVAFVNPS